MRATRSVVAVLAAALMTAAALASPGVSGASRSPVTATPSLRLAASSPPVLFGLQDSGWDPLKSTESKLGVNAGVIGFFRRWGQSADFPTTVANETRAMNAVPMIAWIPIGTSGTVDDPTYSLRSITNGSHDGYIRRWARETRSFGHPVLFRLMPEMNIPHHPYSVGVNGNTATQFVSAWRHIVKIFRNNGATNAIWIWNPNRYFNGGLKLGPMWPGSSWVDWVGIDAYNYGLASHGGWLSFSKLVSPTITMIRNFAPYKPLMLAELGCSETGGSKATWLTNMFKSAQSYGVRMMVWFDFDTSLANWRFDSSSSSMSAARSGVRLSSWTWPGRMSLSHIETYATTGTP